MLLLRTSTSSAPIHTAGYQCPNWCKLFTGVVLMSVKVVTNASPSDKINTVLSSRHTGMSFQRTRLSADCTLMSVIRTSLSMIILASPFIKFFRSCVALARLLMRQRHATSVLRWCCSVFSCWSLGSSTMSSL